MNEIKPTDRPTCACGEKMELIHYKGYYEEFKYWRCDECEIDDKMQDLDGDYSERGAYG